MWDTIDSIHIFYYTVLRPIKQDCNYFPNTCIPKQFRSQTHVFFNELSIAFKTDVMGQVFSLFCWSHQWS